MEFNHCKQVCFLSQGENRSTILVGLQYTSERETDTKRDNELLISSVQKPGFRFFALIVLPDYKGVVCEGFKSVCIVCRSVLIGNPPASKSMTGWEQLDSNSFGTSLHNLPGICVALKNDPHKCLQRLAIGWRYPGIAEQSWAVHHCSQWQGPWFLYSLPWAQQA